MPSLEPISEFEGGYSLIINEFVIYFFFILAFFKMRNNKLQILNLSMNGLGEDCKEFLEKLLKGVHDQF